MKKKDSHSFPASFKLISNPFGRLSIPCCLLLNPHDWLSKTLGPLDDFASMKKIEFFPIPQDYDFLGEKLLFYLLKQVRTNNDAAFHCNFLFNIFSRVNATL